LQIAIAVIWSRGHLLLQLRDFRPVIADPGQWGFFGGHRLPSETPEAGIRRELREELSFTPASLQLLGAFDAEGGARRITGFSVHVDSVADFVLGEGQEMRLFLPEELAAGTAYSDRWARSFPLTQITREALQRWCGVDPRA
jgi:8-oxo-dGTP diphosphatase